MLEQVDRGRGEGLRLCTGMPEPIRTTGDMRKAGNRSWRRSGKRCRVDRGGHSKIRIDGGPGPTILRAVQACKNKSAAGPDWISWMLLKRPVDDRYTIHAHSATTFSPYCQQNGRNSR